MTQILLSSLVDVIYIDGRKDATLMINKVNGKRYRSITIEEH